MTSVTSPAGKYSCYEIALSGRDLGRAEKEKIRDFFLVCGVPGADLACTDYRGIFRGCYYARTSRLVAQIRRRFQSSPWKGIVFRVKALCRHDWFDKWKRDYHIRSLGARFVIVPVWERWKFKSTRRIPILLDPGSAFGSGCHETTRLIVRLLESIRGDFQSFLDIGTGTGILSVAARKIGAQRITAFDYDKPSVTAAKKNFRLNGCDGGAFRCVSLKRLKLKERFSVVGANLLSKTLLEYQKAIKDSVKSGGHLIVSGIALRNFASFRDAFSCAGLKCVKVLRGRQWVALHYKKA